MKNKKGFTLVELLAVIVILAIIALIATPIILNVIDEAKKGAAKASALGYLDAVEKQIAIDQLNPTKASNWTNKTYNKTDLDAMVQVKGSKPTDVSITISGGKISDYSITIDGYKATPDSNGNITVTKVGETPSEEEKNEEVVYKCKRAEEGTLHTEECTQTDSLYYCSGAGYTKSGSKGTTTITYGNLGISGTLTSGDAFDCDVDGDGDYNETTERFYYVSDLSSNSEYAVLVYNNNTSASLIEYDASNENWHGPVTAITKLPTTTQWSNVSLSNTSRAITTETGTTSTSGGTLPTNFSYEGKAARLLTYQEIVAACVGDGNPNSTRALDSCNYLMENTKYSNNSLETIGYWLENPCETNNYDAWILHSMATFTGYNAHGTNFGVRPAIEVLKTDMEITY